MQQRQENWSDNKYDEIPLSQRPPGEIKCPRGSQYADASRNTIMVLIRHYVIPRESKREKALKSKSTAKRKKTKF